MTNDGEKVIVSVSPVTPAAVRQNHGENAGDGGAAVGCTAVSGDCVHNYCTVLSILA